MLSATGSVLLIGDAGDADPDPPEQESQRIGWFAAASALLGLFTAVRLFAGLALAGYWWLYPALWLVLVALSFGGYALAVLR